MKKIIFVLAVLVLAVPVFARVDVTCAQVGTEPNVIVSYNNTEGQPVRAFALNITVDGGATISAVECLNADYYIYPGSIDIEDGEVQEDGWGSCVCDDDYDDTLPGLDSNGVTIEMASLYAAEDPAPADDGQLLKLTLSGNDTVCITIEGNVLRGKVVLEDATSVEPNAPGLCVDLPPADCMGTANPAYAEWVSVGKPDCWCYPRQCRGDIDDAQEYGTYWVLLDDLDEFKTYFMQVGVTDPPGICCDFAHDIEYGTYRVLLNDLDIFKVYFMATTVPCCDQDGDCDETNDDYFNFWTTPAP